MHSSGLENSETGQNLPGAGAPEHHQAGHVLRTGNEGVSERTQHMGRAGRVTTAPYESLAPGQVKEPAVNTVPEQ